MVVPVEKLELLAVVLVEKLELLVLPVALELLTLLLVVPDVPDLYAVLFSEPVVAAGLR